MTAPRWDVYAGPVLAGWPPGTGPLALLGDPPRWMAHPTRRRQPDAGWSYSALVPAEDRERARADLDALVRCHWTVSLKPAAPAFLELRLDPPRPDDGAHLPAASQPEGERS